MSDLILTNNTNTSTILDSSNGEMSSKRVVESHGDIKQSESSYHFTTAEKSSETSYHFTPAKPSESSYHSTTAFHQSNSQGKHLQTFIARVLDWDEHIVKTEWLINKDKGIFQERYFPIEAFKKSFLRNGFLLKVFLSAKKGELKLRFEDGSKFLTESPFPTIIIKKTDSPLFKFNK